MLAEAADVLSDQLRTLLIRLARALRPESDKLEARFLAKLDKLGFDLRERKALSALTLGTAARLLAKGAPPAEFFEEVEYNGRRLAKLNLSPNAIVTALAEYDQLLTPVLRRAMPGEHDNFQWVRDQLQFCVMLTLNNAYYTVREAETQAFYEMFWSELESADLDDLLVRLLAILARFCRADQGHLYLMDSEAEALALRARFGSETAPLGRSVKLRREAGAPHCGSPSHAGAWLLDGSWKKRFATCWSIPMVSKGRLAGVVQFGFHRPYDWLPREQELLMAAAERCVMAAEKARLMQDLGDRERQIRQLAERMMHVEEAERRRISRELHDQTGQDLLWIRLQMEMLERELAEDHPHRSRIGKLRDMTERTIVEIRRLIAALSPAVLESLGLGAAIRQLAAKFSQHSGIAIQLRIGRLVELPRGLEMVVYRLAQECLNNAAKHSKAANVNLSLQTADGKLVLGIEDDGVGFSVGDALVKPGSFGLAGIRERVALMGGCCEFSSQPAGSAVREIGGVAGASGKRSRGGGRRASGGGAGRKTGARIVIELPIAGQPKLGAGGGRLTGLKAAARQDEVN